MTIVASLKDGRIIVREVSSEYTVAIGGATQAVTITFADLKKVEYLINITATTDPVVAAELGVPQNPVITGNMVGFTIYVGAGTTLVVEGQAIGF